MRPGVAVLEAVQAHVQRSCIWPD